MAQPYVGEIRMFAGTFAPLGWMFCNGQVLAISENETLFQLIGTTYGGDGQQTFALPDLRGRVPIHVNTDPTGVPRALGATGGREKETLTENQLPPHMHRTATSAPSSKTSPVANLTGDTGLNLIYADGAGAALASSNATAPAGGSQPHDNMMPYLCVHFIVSLFGIFPSPQ